jgi:hypothetical protein
MKKTLFLSMTLAVALSACAMLPIGTAVLGQQVSVTLPAEIPMPDAVTLELDPAVGRGVKLASAITQALGGGSLEDRLGGLIKQQSAGLRQQGATLFKQKLEAAKLFGPIVSDGGNVGLSLGVARYGLAYSSVTYQYQLVLDVEMKLSEPHVGVIWSGKRSAADLGADVKKLSAKVDVAKLLANPKALDELSQAALKDLTVQLLEDLRQHPPLSQFVPQVPAQ